MNTRYEATLALDPALDLVIRRNIPVSLSKVWRAWTDPEQLKKWWCPRPWTTSEVSLDLRPGGRMYTVMNGPNGEVAPNDGCYLEIVPEQRLVFTDFLLPGFRPNPKGFMVGIFHVEPDGNGGSNYLAVARHANPETTKMHEEMGFHHGWNAVIDQLVELARGW